MALPAFAANHVLSWSLNATNEAVTGYNLYRQAGTPPAWVKIASVGAVNTVTVSNVSSGWSIYSLTATNAIGESPSSQPVSAFVPLMASPPTNVIVNLQARVSGSSGNQVASFSVATCATERTTFFHGELIGTNFNIMAGAALGGPSGAIAMLHVPIEATQSRLFAGR